MSKVGKRANDFTLTNQHGEEVNLYSLLETGSVVLFFYPKDFTAGCTKEVCSFRDRYHELTAAGVTVIGVSRDDEESHSKFSQQHQLPYSILSDTNGVVHELYEVRKYLGLFMNRETFLINQEKEIKYHFANNLQFEKHVRVMLKQIKREQ